jgi:hypothetical protein
MIMDNAIKKIVLDLGGKEVTLTPQQAKNPWMSYSARRLSKK